MQMFVLTEYCLNNNTMSVLHSICACFCPQSCTGHRNAWKRRIARMQTQSVAQATDNMEERRQEDPAE